MEIFDHIVYTEEIIGIGPLSPSFPSGSGKATFYFELFLKNGAKLSIESPVWPATHEGPYGTPADIYRAKYEEHKCLIRALDLAKRRSDGGAWNQSNVASFTEMPT